MEKKMSKKQKIEKAISICYRESASLNEIFEGCTSICKITVRKTHEKETSKGLLSGSCSINGIALCIWQEQKGTENKFDRLCQSIISVDQVETLQGLIDLMMRRHFAEKGEKLK